MNKRPVQYEPHPVSRERKLELKAQGFKIVDAKFAPAAKQEPLKRQTRKQIPEGVN
jgi:hypothetical protein